LGFHDVEGFGAGVTSPWPLELHERFDVVASWGVLV